MVLFDFLLSADRFLFKRGLRKTEVYGGGLLTNSFALVQTGLMFARWASGTFCALCKQVFCRLCFGGMTIEKDFGRAATIAGGIVPTKV